MDRTPGLRAFGSASLGGIFIFGVVAFWMHWPLFLAVAIGAVFLVAGLLVAGTLADDGRAAEAAWRAASADLPRGAAGDPDAPAADEVAPPGPIGAAPRSSARPRSSAQPRS